MNYEDILEGLERANAPVELELRSKDPWTSRFEVYWRADGERTPVGSLEVYGSAKGKRRMLLTTERTEFSRPGRPIRYTKVEGLVKGLLRWAIPLKDNEHASLARRQAERHVEDAYADLNEEYGRAHRLITKEWRTVQAEICYGTGGAKLKRLKKYLLALEEDYQIALDKYEELMK